MRLSTVGKRAFSVSGAALWNDLPPHVTSAASLAIFRQRLKSFLFSQSSVFGHSYLTHIAYYYLFIFVDLAIIDIIQTTLEIMMMMMMMIMIANGSLHLNLLVSSANAADCGLNL